MSKFIAFVISLGVLILSLGLCLAIIFNNIVDLIELYDVNQTIAGQQFLSIEEFKFFVQHVYQESENARLPGILAIASMLWLLILRLLRWLDMKRKINELEAELNEIRNLNPLQE